MALRCRQNPKQREARFLERLQRGGFVESLGLKLPRHSVDRPRSAHRRCENGEFERKNHRLRGAFFGPRVVGRDIRMGEPFANRLFDFAFDAECHRLENQFGDRLPQARRPRQSARISGFPIVNRGHDCARQRVFPPNEYHVTRAIWLLPLFHPPENLQPSRESRAFQSSPSISSTSSACSSPRPKTPSRSATFGGRCSKPASSRLSMSGRSRKLAKPNTSKNFRVVT